MLIREFQFLNFFLEVKERENGRRNEKIFARKGEVKGVKNRIICNPLTLSTYIRTETNTYIE